jgi:hypothetical protein
MKYNKDLEQTGKQMKLFSQEVSLANHTQQQESDLEKKTSAIFGPKCLELFGRFSRNGLWAKTFAALLVGQEGWYSRRCGLTWKLLGTKYNRLYFQLQASTHHTNESEFGLWPTPIAGDWKGQKRSDGTASMLSGVVALMLPTPTTRDANGIEHSPSQKNKSRLAPTIGDLYEQELGTSSQLNPEFVLEMMGFPTDWTLLPFQSGETKVSRPQETQ